MYMVICCCTQSQFPEIWVPWMHIFSMYQGQPVCIQATKCHIRPDVRINKSSCQKQWYQNHQKGVCRRPIESIEKSICRVTRMYDDGEGRRRRRRRRRKWKHRYINRKSTKQRDRGQYDHHHHHHLLYKLRVDHDSQQKIMMWFCIL